ncbi:hypothetical protein GS884_07625 [Rhodococcus hoagii]|nr:hypothetical protein [Prescottella equi]
MCSATSTCLRPERSVRRLALSAFGLAPFALVMLQMRVFYAGNDMRTPALINIAMVSMKIAVVGAMRSRCPVTRWS